MQNATVAGSARRLGLAAASLFLVAVALPQNAPAQIRLLGDLEKKTHPNSGSKPFEFIQMGGWTYFVVVHSPVGSELFRTAGPAATAQLVADIRPGPDHSGIHGLTVFQNRLYFQANDGVRGRELWTSDGTAAGTMPVLDLAPGATGSHPHSLAVLGNRLYFTAQHPTLGSELFATDGTAIGTTLVRDIAPGGTSSNPGGTVAIGGALWFQADDTIHGPELWRSDGTSAGTVLVRDINLNTTGETGSRPLEFTALGTAVCFTATIDGEFWGVWRTDGTAAGTVEIARFAASTPHLRNRTVAGLRPFGGRILCVGETLAQGSELWILDGTANGTRIVADLTPGSVGSAVQGLEVLGNLAFFVASDGSSQGRQVWKTDGTTAGTLPMLSTPPFTGIRDMAASGGRLFLSATSALGNEIWASDGTAAGTTLLRDIRPGAESSLPLYLTPIGGGRIVFQADDGIVGAEVWTSDGTASGTTLAADAFPPEPGSPGSLPRDRYDHYGTVYFTATTLQSGWELWKTDGTAIGTTQVADIWPKANGSKPVVVGTAGDHLLLTATGSNGRPGLWRTDGTASRTTLVREFSSIPIGFTPWRRTLIFSAISATGRGLWVSDGTTAGTRELKAFPNLYLPLEFAVTPAGVYLTAIDRSFVLDLWRTDGTVSGTGFVGSPDVKCSQASRLHGFGEQLLFQAGQELWQSDGTSRGTSLLADIHPSGGSFPVGFTTVGDQVFFVANDGSTGHELWRTDGTRAGTNLVADIRPGISGSMESVSGGPMVCFDDRFLLFAADDLASGIELWISDGTTAGTRQVADIFPGRGSSVPAGFVTTGSRFAYFYGTHPNSGRELWRTDGTAAGTVLVQDYNPGTASIAWAQQTPTLSNGRLILSGDDGIRGDEPVALDLLASSQPRGTACGSRSAPTLRATDPVLGGTLRASGRGAPGGTTGAISVSVPALPLAVGACEFYLDPATLILLNLGVRPSGGAWSTSYPVANQAVLLGLPLVIQIGFGPTAGPLGMDLSNGVLLTLGR